MTAAGVHAASMHISVSCLEVVTSNERSLPTEAAAGGEGLF